MKAQKVSKSYHKAEDGKKWYQHNNLAVTSVTLDEVLKYQQKQKKPQSSEHKMKNLQPRTKYLSKDKSQKKEKMFITNQQTVNSNSKFRNKIYHLYWCQKLKL